MSLIEFSSRHYLQQERPDAVRDACATIANVEPEIPHGSAFDLSMRVRLLPGVAIAFAECSRLSIHRGAAQLADGNDDITMFLNPGSAGSDSGWVVHQHGTGEMPCPAGAGCVGLNERQGYIDFHGSVANPAHFLSISFPRERLLPLLANTDDALRQPLRESEALRLLARQALELTGVADAPSAGPALPRLSDDTYARMGERLLDLGALALGATPEARANAGTRGLRQARLKAIKADLAVHAWRGDLSLEWVAARHRITPRYLRALFEREGLAFSDWLLEQRLQRTLNQLADPRHAHRTISAIAFDAGFNNLSWFYRAFKRRFAMTPRDARHGVAMTPA